MDGPAPEPETGGAPAAGQGPGLQAPNVIAEGVPPEHRIGGHSEPEPEDDLHTRPPGPSAVIPSPVNRSVSLRWLKEFAAENRGKRFSFERREFMAPIQLVTPST